MVSIAAFQQIKAYLKVKKQSTPCIKININRSLQAVKIPFIYFFYALLKIS